METEKVAKSVGREFGHYEKPKKENPKRDIVSLKASFLWIFFFRNMVFVMYLVLYILLRWK